MYQCSILLLTILLFCVSCSQPSIAWELENDLTAPHGWTIEYALKDGNADDTFRDLTIQFSKSEYTTNLVNNLVWPANGEYTHEDSSSGVLIRDDQNALIVSVVEGRLKIEIEYEIYQPIGARSASVHYSFLFSPGK